jgi:hypothetical protein
MLQKFDPLQKINKESDYVLGRWAQFKGFFLLFVLALIQYPVPHRGLEILLLDRM